MNAQIGKKEDAETYYEAFRAAHGERKEQISGGMDQAQPTRGGRRGVLIMTVHFGCVSGDRVVDMTRGKVSHREEGPALPGMVNRKYFDLSTEPSKEGESTCIFCRYPSHASYSIEFGRSMYSLDTPFSDYDSYKAIVRASLDLPTRTGVNSVKNSFARSGRPGSRCEILYGGVGPIEMWPEGMTRVENW